MDIHIAETLQMLIGMGAGVIILVSGMRIWLRKKELERPTDTHLERTVEQLRLEVQDLRAEQTELLERLEFTERMLAKGKTD